MRRGQSAQNVGMSGAMCGARSVAMTGATGGPTNGAHSCVVHPALRTGPPGARADAELCTKRVIEIRYVVEAAVQRDLDDFCRIVCQPQRRCAKARAQHVLMWRHAAHLLKCAQ